MTLKLTLAISDYDHVRDLTSGDVKPEGIDINHLKLSVEEIFFRFTKFREFDVSEMSFGKYVSLISRDDHSLTAIPVFPSRVFRHSAIYVRKDGPVHSAADLKGRRVGLPEWAQTAAIYVRGFLTDQFKLKLSDIDWHQAGVAQPGRVEKVELDLPKGVRLTRHPDRTLNDMLLDGTIDAISSAHAPPAFEAGDPRITRLIGNYRTVEEAYFRQTGIFPIMHVVAIRRDVIDANPWVPTTLYKAFDEARRRGIARLFEATASRMPIPWLFNVAEESRFVFGDGEYWPYGLEPNRRTLEAFLTYAHKQGVAAKRLKPEALFHPSVLQSYKV